MPFSDAALREALTAAFQVDDLLAFPVLREAYRERRYRHWWQGWLSTNHATYFLGARLYPFTEHGGLIRVEEHSDESYNPETGDESYWTWEERHFCGWDELLRPMVTRYRDVEIPQPQPAEFELTPNGAMLDLKNKLYWDTSLSAGQYTKINVRKRDGTLLLSSAFYHPIDVDWGSLEVTSLAVEASQ